MGSRHATHTNHHLPFLRELNREAFGRLIADSTPEQLKKLPELMEILLTTPVQHDEASACVALNYWIETINGLRRQPISTTALDDDARAAHRAQQAEIAREFLRNYRPLETNQ
jgi:hypothetical protein